MKTLQNRSINDPSTCEEMMKYHLRYGKNVNMSEILKYEKIPNNAQQRKQIQCCNRTGSKQNSSLEFAAQM